jgi:hypothetical protein
MASYGGTAGWNDYNNLARWEVMEKLVACPQYVLTGTNIDSLQYVAPASGYANYINRDVVLRIPCGAMSAYGGASGWNDYTNLAKWKRNESEGNNYFAYLTDCEAYPSLLNRIELLLVPCGAISNYKDSTWDYLLPDMVDLQPCDVDKLSGYNPWEVAGWDGSTNPFTIGSGKTVTIYPCDCENITSESMSVPSNITIANGGQLKNLSDACDYGAVVERTLAFEKWEFVGTPIGTTTFGWFSNDYLYLSGGATQVPDEIITFNGTTDMSAYWHTPHNYIVSYPFNYTSNEWDAPNVYRTTSMKQGEGYFVWNGGEDHFFDEDGTYYEDGDGAGIGADVATTVKFYTATLPNAATYSVSSLSNSNSPKWFSISNPYPAAIQSKEFVEQQTNLQGGAVYIWDGANGNYKLYDADDVAANPDATAVTGDNVAIMPTQGFFVAYTATPTISFKKTMYDVSAAKMGEKSGNQYTLFLNAMANNYTKDARIKIKETASNDFDINDAFVMIGDNPSIVEPYFVESNKELAINAIKELPYQVPLNLHVGQSCITDLTLTNIPNGVTAELVDLQEGTVTDMRTNSYSANIVAGENAGRFILKLGGEIVSNPESPAVSNEINAWVYENRMTIDGKDLTNVEVYNITGQRVFAASITGNHYTNTINVPSGSYILKAVSKSGTKNVKFTVINK